MDLNFDLLTLSSSNFGVGRAAGEMLSETGGLSWKETVQGNPSKLKVGATASSPGAISKIFMFVQRPSSGISPFLAKTRFTFSKVGLKM